MRRLLRFGLYGGILLVLCGCNDSSDDPAISDPQRGENTDFTQFPSNNETPADSDDITTQPVIGRDEATPVNDSAAGDAVPPEGATEKASEPNNEVADEVVVDQERPILFGRILSDDELMQPVEAHIIFFASSDDDASALVESRSNAADGSYSLVFDKSQLFEEDLLLHVIAEGYVTGVFVINGQELLQQAQQRDFLLQAANSSVVEPERLVAIGDSADQELEPENLEPENDQQSSVEQSLPQQTLPGTPPVSGDGGGQGSGQQTSTADAATPAEPPADNVPEGEQPVSAQKPGGFDWVDLSGGTFNRHDFTPIYTSVPIHHLGDNNYSGLPNSQFQIAEAEGILYTSPIFALSEEQQSPSQAYLTLLVKGSQQYNPVSFNGVEVGGLGYSSLSGAYMLRRIKIPVSLLASQNVITIESQAKFDTSSVADYDDFEFSDIKLIIDE